MSASDRISRGRRAAAGIAAAAALTAALPASAQRSFALNSIEARRYADCMAEARSNPRAAHDEAVAWRLSGGGNPALHCVAVALLGLGEYAQAAQSLEALARAAGVATPGLRADLLGQAGNAWIIAGRPAEAHGAQSAALAIRPDDVDLLIDRAITLGSTGRYWEALDDLNRALSLDPDRPDALVFRASAWRHLESYDLAADDAARALGRAPRRPDALLERGLIRKARGDLAGARADWMKVLALAAEGPAREAARRELERMDVKVR